MDALTNPIWIGKIKKGSSGKNEQRFIGKKATVNINPDEGTITTLWKTGTKTIKKIERKGEKNV